MAQSYLQDVLRWGSEATTGKKRSEDSWVFESRSELGQCATWGRRSTTGTTSNNGVITFPAPTANWGVVTCWGILDASTGGNLWIYSALTTNKTINNGDAAPSFAAAAATFQIDN